MVTEIKDVQLMYLDDYLVSVQLKMKDGKWRSFELPKKKRYATPIIKTQSSPRKVKPDRVLGSG